MMTGGLGELCLPQGGALASGRRSYGWSCLGPPVYLSLGTAMSHLQFPILWDLDCSRISSGALKTVALRIFRHLGGGAHTSDPTALDQPLLDTYCGPGLDPGFFPSCPGPGAKEVGDRLHPPPSVHNPATLSSAVTQPLGSD